MHLQICVPVEHTEHVCNEMIADSRTIVVGAAEGVLHAFTWHGKVRIHEVMHILCVVVYLMHAHPQHLGLGGLQPPPCGVVDV